ncbi:hypothetical protein [Nonomuraea sp. NPDC052265]|uniref:hypothetical protein n=1 Tax=Nonomuraea sp. NPDC052265 TaxID=3364374 RepID=UPI0037C7C1D9
MHPAREQHPLTGPENLAHALTHLTDAAQHLTDNRHPHPEVLTHGDRREEHARAALTSALIGIGHAIAAQTLATALGTPGAMGRRDPVEHREWLTVAGRLNRTAAANGS